MQDINHMVDKALAVAIRAHAGQKYGTQDYIEHVKRVAEKFNNPLYKIVALLHDVVEDSKYDTFDIECMFDDDIAQIVDTLSRSGQDYLAIYIPRIKQDPVACAIKIEDLRDHLAHMEMFPEKQSLKPRYEKALAYLLNEQRL